MPTRSAITLPVLVAALVAFLAPPAICQEPPPAPVVTLTAPDTSPLGQWVPISLTAPESRHVLVRVIHVRDGRDLDVSQGGVTPNLIDLGQGRYAFTAPIIGRFAVEAYVVTDAEVLQAETQFAIGADPQPDPPPDPPDPATVPFPSPDGLRVLILEETAARGTLPESQIEILIGDKVRRWLSANTVRDDHDGYRVWDDDYTPAQLAKVTETWQKAYAAAGTLSDGKLPWIVAANGSRGYSGPLPDDADSLLAILERLK